MATAPGATGAGTTAPARRSNASIYIVATILVLVVGLLIAGGILLVTGRAKTPAMKGLVRFGVAKSIKETAKEGGPFAFAGSTGDSGFWVALEDGKIVALKIRKPGPSDCNVIWKGSRDTFVDCNNDPIRMDQLARYPIEVPESGKNKGQFLVNLSGNIPPPAGS